VSYKIFLFDMSIRVKLTPWTSDGFEIPRAELPVSWSWFLYFLPNFILQTKLALFFHLLFTPQVTPARLWVVIDGFLTLSAKSRVYLTMTPTSLVCFWKRRKFATKWYITLSCCKVRIYTDENWLFWKELGI